jgi:hypothetical protein
VSLFHEGKKPGILLRLTNHNILENREFVANSQRFAERSGTARRSRNHKGRGVGEPEDWSGVLARSGKSMGSKRPALLLENRRPSVPRWRKSRCTEGRKGHEDLSGIGSCHDLALPKEWGARETREKTRKGMRGVGWEGQSHRSTRHWTRDALLRDPAWHVQKNVQRQYLTCPSELVSLRVGPETARKD